MLLPPSVEDYVSEGSPLRALDAFVDGLDLARLGFGVRDADSAGRSSYDPASLTKLYLWGYLKRCRSSRGLEEACATNLGAIWLTGNLQPDHSTISDFRKKHSGPLKKIFREFNLLCIELDLFGRELVAIDGTFTKGVNSAARSFTRAKLVKLIEGIDAAIERYLERLYGADAEVWSPRSKRSPKSEKPGSRRPERAGKHPKKGGSSNDSFPHGGDDTN